MSDLELLTKAIFYSLKPLFIFVDFIFRLCGLKILNGSYSKHLLYICGVVGYICLLKKTEHAFRDDIILAGCTSVYACVTLCYVFELYTGHIVRLLCKFCCTVQKYGKVRFVIYAVSVVLVAAVFTCAGVQVVSFAFSAFKENMMWRLDDNVIEIPEDRTIFEEKIIHPVTHGEKYPLFLSKFYRYPMEDIKMSCEFTKVWLSDAHPTDYQVVWRKNGVPLTITDRHKHQLHFKEIVDNETITGMVLKSRGLSNYELNATLSIQLLRKSDFGSYTCHCAKHMNISVNNFSTNFAKLFSEKSKKKKQQKRKISSSRRQNEVEEKRLFKDEFLHVGEFRLIQVQRREEIVRAPAGAILKFTTSYWHHSWEDEVEVDYSVNRQSYNNLCQDSYFHGCSKVLLLYRMFRQGEGDEFRVPPLQLLTVWKNPDFPAKRYSLVHCLCENAYGYHNVKYLRRYYNTTTQRFELIKVLHPHVLVVVPREQHMLNVFKNRSQSLPVIERSVCEKPSSVCKTSWDIQTMKDFGEAVVNYFHYAELAVIVGVFMVFMYSFRKMTLFLECVGRHIRRLSLHGSMGYLTTAERVGLYSQHQSTASGTPETQQNEETHYDVFLSFSETQIDTERVQDNILPILENCGLKVCFRDRDLAPNLQEIQGISKAIENSDKFLIFLSSAYFEDHFRKDFEAIMIMEVLTNRSNGVASVLLIKLEQCEVPLCLKSLSLHDWTTANLTPHDHYLRLLKWLEPRESRCTFRSKLDVFMTVLPVLSAGMLSAIVYMESTSVLSAANWLFS